MKITVLSGGLSPERDVSLSSGALIANALVRNGHSVALLDLYLGTDREVQWLNTADFSYKIPDCEPDLDALKASVGRSDEIGPGIIEACLHSDCTFLALHGGIGENGDLQAQLDHYNIRYTGSKSEACMLAMDKDLTKRSIVAAGINTAKWVTFPSDRIDEKRILEEIGLPCVVKPLSCGSSVGVSLVYTRRELSDALKLSVGYEKRILVEKLVHGREFAVGVLDGRALPPIEIRPKIGFYDYKSKYQSGMTEEICPADLTPSQNNEAMEMALSVHNTLGLGCYSRSDVILDEQTGKFVCLEVNALPGMTPTSLLPQEAAAIGIDYGKLCEIIATHTVSGS